MRGMTLRGSITGLSLAGLLCALVPVISLGDEQEGSHAPAYIIEFGHDLPEGSAIHEAAIRYADMVRLRSQGRIQVQVFPGQERGTDQQMVDMLRKGTLDICLPPTAKLTTLVPDLQLLDLPFFFPSREAVYAALDQTPGQHLLAKLRPHGLLGFTFWESGFKQFSGPRRIQGPEDFKGLKMRTMKSKMIMNQFKLLGAHPIPIDFLKVYDALKNRDVDGQENPLGSIVGMGFYEVQSHVTLSDHAYLAQVFAFSKKRFDTYPRDIQNILKQTAIEVSGFQRREAERRELAYIAEINDKGVTVTGLTTEQKAAFKSHLSELVEEYKTHHDAELLKQTLRIINPYEAQPERVVYIGLDADLSLGGAQAGHAIKRGIELALHEINDAGGLLGNKVQLLVRDHEGMVPRGLKNITHFASLSNMLAVVGGLHSPVALAELKSIHEHELIYLDPWAAATKIVDNGHQPNYVFRVSVRDEYAGEFLVSNALKKHKRIALLLENTPWGRGNERSMTEALSRRGTEAVAIEWFNWGQKNMLRELQAIKAADAEVILLVANAPEAVSLINNMHQYAVDLPIISHWGITGGYFWEAVSSKLADIDLNFLQTFSLVGNNSPSAQDFVQKYFTHYGVTELKDMAAVVGTIHAYDLIKLLAQAVSSAGSLDRSKVRDSLEQVQNVQGVMQLYEKPFTTDHHDALAPDQFLLARYDDDGMIVPVKE